MTQHCFKSILAEHFDICPLGRHEQNVFKSFSLSLSGHNNHNGNTTLNYPTDHKWLFLFVFCCFVFVSVNL